MATYIRGFLIASSLSVFRYDQSNDRFLNARGVGEIGEGTATGSRCRCVNRANVFAADHSTEKKLCRASMLHGNDAKFLLRD